MSPEQAIALAEILPEVKTLAHINLLENPSLASVAEADTEAKKEEACALYASLLAAVRVSKTLVKVDVDEPSTEAGELVKALANQVVAYCMRNLQGVPDIRDISGGDQGEIPKYPQVLRHLVGYDGDGSNTETDDEPTPDDDYVIGGTGVVKALTCCLKNIRGDDDKRQSGEFAEEFETGEITSPSSLPPSKAKDVPKDLLATARKIRIQLQPALAQAKASAFQDMPNYRKHPLIFPASDHELLTSDELDRLVFLDQTIEGIIKRFESEFPETRQATPSVPNQPDQKPPMHHRTFSISSDGDAAISDTEEMGTAILSPTTRSRSNSILSHTSRALAEEEGRTLRVGHKFRRNFLRSEHYGLLTSTEEIKNDPAHTELIEAMLEEVCEDDEGLRRKVQEQGAVKTFQEDKDLIMQRLRDTDPAYWANFIEAQEKARANLKVGTDTETFVVNGSKHTGGKGITVDEQAIMD